MLTASARISWIPTTAEEIVAYKQKEVNVVTVALMSYDTNGLGVMVNSPYKFYGGDVNSTNLFVVMTNTITQLLSDYFSQNTPGTNKYYTSVTFDSPYIPGTHSGGVVDLPIEGDRVSGRSPDFRFVPPGAKVIPPEAYNIQVDWIGPSFILPDVGQGVKWVEYYNRMPWSPDTTNYTDYYNLTVNGANTVSEWTRTMGVLYMESDMIVGGEIIVTNHNSWTSRFITSITFWYDDAHTNNGTRWTWSSNGCVKTEIYPPVAKLTTSVASNGVWLTVSGGYKGQIYVLEGKGMVDGNWTPFGAVLTDGNGGANWLMPAGAQNQFVRARMAREGEFPPQKLSIFSDGSELNLFMVVPPKDAGHSFFGLQGASSPAGPFKPVPVSVGGGQKVFLPNAQALAVWRIAPNPLQFFRVVTY